MGNRKRTGYLIRALAGVYLAYLGYTLLKGLFTGAEGYNIIFAVCGVAFIVIGVGLVVSCLRYMKSEAAQQAMIEESEEEADTAGEDVETAEDAKITEDGDIPEGTAADEEAQDGETDEKKPE